MSTKRDNATGATVAQGAKQTSDKTNHSPLATSHELFSYADYPRYELLKSQFTATATTPAEYEAACRRAALIAGV